MIQYENISLCLNEELIHEGNIRVENEQITLLSGASGAGKSTLLYDLLLLSQRCHGQYFLDGQDISHISKNEQEEIRKNQFAFVPQTLLLFPHLNYIENIRVYALMNHHSFDEELARSYLNDLFLYLDEKTTVENLSGGEQQRLMIVCALMKDTPYIFMDEPTAYLDSESKQQLIDILQLLRDKYHKTIFVTSHDTLIENICDAHYRIENKKIVCLKQEKSHATTISIKNTVFNYRQFIKEKRKKERNRMILLHALLTVIFIFSSLFSALYFYYQKGVEKQLKALYSSQIVIDLKREVTGEIIHQIDRMENVSKVVPLYPLIIDNQYQIMPYFSNDDFHGATVYHQNNNHIYINYEGYRQYKYHPAMFYLNNQSYCLEPTFILPQNYNDYGYYTNMRKCLYVPYKLYQQMVQPSETSLVILNIDDKAQYMNVIQSLYQNESSLEILDKPNILYMFRLQETIQQFSSITTICMYLFVVCVFIVVKIIDDYQSKVSDTILKINGISYVRYTLYLMFNEFMQIVSSAFLSFICVYGVLCGLKINELNVLLVIFSLMVFLIFGLFLVIYFIMNRIYTPIRVIKTH